MAVTPPLTTAQRVWIFQTLFAGLLDFFHARFPLDTSWPERVRGLQSFRAVLTEQEEGALEAANMIVGRLANGLAGHAVSNDALLDRVDLPELIRGMMRDVWHDGGAAVRQRWVDAHGALDLETLSDHEPDCGFAAVEFVAWLDEVTHA